ncbi:MAG: Na+/H+ antiporter subunit E [Actinobacteria bacterium]|nr:Na+/H+ antiporter subunit E [Actinomycetota bacterium]
MSRLTLGFGLLIAWMLMWGSASPGTIVGGALVIAVMYAIFPSTRHALPSFNLHPKAVVWLVAYFAKQVVKSNFLLSIEVLRPHPSIRTTAIDVPMHTSSPSILTAVSNMCAMSPGTMVVGVNVEPPVLRAHILVFGAQSDHSVAVRGIYALERYATAAFGAEQDRRDYAANVESGIDPVEVVV